MSLRKPPALADWLLNRFRLPESNPPLAGDLLEEFRSGRSRAWYWRQTIAAIASRASHNARDSSILLVATCLSWFAQASIAYTLWRFHLPPPLPMWFGAALVGAIVCVWSIVALTSGKSGLTKLRSTLSNCQYACLDPLLSASRRAAEIWGRLSPSSPVNQLGDWEISFVACVFFLFLGWSCFSALLGRDSLAGFLATQISWIAATVFIILLHPPEGKAA